MDIISKARLDRFVDRSKRYHSELPDELKPFYCYTIDGGHSIIVVLENEWESGKSIEDFLCPASVRTVLRHGYTVRDGYIWTSIPYSMQFGLIQEAGDYEYDDQTTSVPSAKVPKETIHVGNNGQNIRATNYWGSSYAAKGYFFLSINAGAFRLLVPDSRVAEITEWTSAREVIVTRGPWPWQETLDALEIMFEDDSESPYSLMLTRGLCDRMPPVWDADKNGQPPRRKFSAWTRNGKVLELPCRYRIARKLPCLQEWQQ